MAPDWRETGLKYRVTDTWCRLCDCCSLISSCASCSLQDLLPDSDSLSGVSLMMLVQVVMMLLTLELMMIYLVSWFLVATTVSPRPPY